MGERAFGARRLRLHRRVARRRRRLGGVHLNLIRHHAIVDGGDALPVQFGRRLRGGDHDDEILSIHLQRVVRERVVRVRVEHDDGKGENVRRLGAWVRVVIARAKPRGERLHQPIDLLRLARKFKPTEERSKGVVDVRRREIEPVDVRAHHGERVRLVRSEQFTDRAGTQTTAGSALAQKVGALGGIFRSRRLLKRSDARVGVERLGRLLHGNLGLFRLLETFRLGFRRFFVDNICDRLVVSVDGIVRLIFRRRRAVDECLFVDDGGGGRRHGDAARASRRPHRRHRRSKLTVEPRIVVLHR